MKKVLYISYDGMTDPLGQSQVIPYLKGLAGQYRITILSFEKPHRYQQRASLIRGILNDSGIDWIPKMFNSKVPILSKVYDQFQMTSTAEKLFKERQFDFIHCRSYVAAEAALRLKQKFGVPFIFDMRGFWVDERVDAGQWDLSKPLYRWLYKRFKKKEKQYFQACSQLISLTHVGKEELITHYNVDPGKLSVIPCCVDLEHFDYTKVTAAEQEVVRQNLGISDGDKIISYLGSLGGWYLTDEMLRFFKVMQKHIQGVKFLLITPDSRESVVARALHAGVSEVDIIVKEAARNEVPAMLSLSNWSIFFIKDAYSKKASSPTKQAEIMAMGIPIICNDIGDTGRIVVESGAGYLVPDFSNESLDAVAIALKLGTMPTKEHIRGEACKYFNLESGIAAYKAVYDKMERVTGSEGHD